LIFMGAPYAHGVGQWPGTGLPYANVYINGYYFGNVSDASVPFPSGSTGNDAGYTTYTKAYVASAFSYQVALNAGYNNVSIVWQGVNNNRKSRTTDVIILAAMR